MKTKDVFFFFESDSRRPICSLQINLFIFTFQLKFFKRKNKIKTKNSLTLDGKIREARRNRTGEKENLSIPKNCL